jgi:polyphosphate kinase
MDRNMFRRIEVMFPVLDRSIKRRLISDLDLYLADNTQSWNLSAGGQYQPLTADDDIPVRVQTELLEQLAEAY